MLGLSKRQTAVLTAIESYIAENGYSPSYTDILERTSLRGKANIARIVKVLEERGYIQRSPRRARSIGVIRAHPSSTKSP